MYKSFHIEEKKLEKLFIKLFLCAPDFALLFTLNIYETNNEFEKFISVLRTKNIDKYLLSI